MIRVSDGINGEVMHLASSDFFTDLEKYLACHFISTEQRYNNQPHAENDFRLEL